MPELPIVRGVFLCDTVIAEERTRNLTLVNCFTSRLVEEFPTPPQKFAVVALLVNGLGTIPIDLRIVSLEDDTQVFHRQFSIPFTDPLQETRFVYRVQSLSFPNPGGYEVSLASAGEILVIPHAAKSEAISRVSNRCVSSVVILFRCVVPNWPRVASMAALNAG